MEDFLGNLFEIFGYNPNTYDLLRMEVYRPAAFTLVFVNFAVAFYFYLLLTPGRATFYKHRHWFMALVSGASLSAFACWLIAQKAIGEDEEYGFFDFSEFLLAVCLWSLPVFFIFSIVLKRFNPSRRHLPITKP
jgi:hypothetical protein